MKRLPFFAAALLVLALGASSVSARTLRVFAVGNSFSGNATAYLPQLAKAGGHELILGTAQTGKAAPERHWKAAEAELANPGSKEAKIYGGKSLAEIISKGKWDVVTIQQYSLLSSDIEPCPAKVARPSPDTSARNRDRRASDVGIPLGCESLWPSSYGKTSRLAARNVERSRAAYQQIAGDLGALFPWAMRFVRRFRSQMGLQIGRELRLQESRVSRAARSEHVVARWLSLERDKKLSKDANHANVAGQYLGGRVVRLLFW